MNEIKENEHLHLFFESKYEEAVEIIKGIYDENMRLEEALEIAKKRPYKTIYEDEKQNSSTDNNDSNLSFPYISPLKIEEDSKKNSSNKNSSIGCKNNENKRNQKNSDKVSEFNLNNNEKDTNTPARRNSYNELEKMKEDYCNLFIEKTHLETSLNELNLIKEEREKLRKESEGLKSLNEMLTEKVNYFQNEYSNMKQQIETLSSAKTNLLAELSTLKTNYQIIEDEKTSIKIKNAHHLSKFQSMEKEISKLNKKNNNLKNNVQDLLKKVSNCEKEKNTIQERMDSKIQTLENKIIVLEQEKNAVKKETLSDIIESTMNSQSDFGFYYLPISNKIQIKLKDQIIGEVKNSNEFKKPSLNISGKREHEDSFLKSPMNPPGSLKRMLSLGGFSESSIKSIGSLDKENININFLNQINEEYSSPLNIVPVKKISNFENKDFALKSCINKININDTQKCIELKTKFDNYQIVQSNTISIENDLKKKNVTEFQPSNLISYFYICDKQNYIESSQQTDEQQAEEESKNLHYQNFVMVNNQLTTQNEMDESNDSINNDNKNYDEPFCDKNHVKKVRGTCFNCTIF